MSAEMNVYLVTLVDKITGELKRILVRSECSHGMQAFVDTLDDLGIGHPVVVDIDDTVAAHLANLDLIELA